MRQSFVVTAYPHKYTHRPIFRAALFAERVTETPLVVVHAAGDVSIKTDLPMLTLYET